MSIDKDYQLESFIDFCDSMFIETDKEDYFIAMESELYPLDFNKNDNALKDDICHIEIELEDLNEHIYAVHSKEMKERRNRNKASWFTGKYLKPVELQDLAQRKMKEHVKEIIQGIRQGDTHVSIIADCAKAIGEMRKGPVRAKKTKNKENKFEIISCLKLFMVFQIKYEDDDEGPGIRIVTMYPIQKDSDVYR